MIKCQRGWKKGKMHIIAFHYKLKFDSQHWTQKNMWINNEMSIYSIHLLNVIHFSGFRSCGLICSLLLESAFPDFALAFPTFAFHANKSALMEGRAVRG